MIDGVPKSETAYSAASSEPAARMRYPLSGGDHAVRVGVPGLLPFGILWAAPVDGGAAVQLWTDDYERSDLVRVEDGVARPDSYRHERTVDPGETVSQTYAFGRDVDALAATDYSVWGVLWVRWPSHDGQRVRDWNADIYPYELTLGLDPV